MPEFRTLKTIVIVLFFIGISMILHGQTQKESSLIIFPDPKLKGDMSVEEALQNRRSRRQYSNAPLSKEDLGQILWAAQGITEKQSTPPGLWGDRPWPGGFRTAPSAGALYPLDVYAVVGRVKDMEPGVYVYLPGKHALELTVKGDLRKKLAQAALDQTQVRDGAAVLVISGVYARCAAKYGNRAQRYTHIETGHVGQNIYLQAESLGIGTVMAGAFNDKQVQSVLELSKEEMPLAVMSLGYRN
jgi:SagB-type dehydrogenase family enzyme